MRFVNELEGKESKARSEKRGACECTCFFVRNAE